METRWHPLRRVPTQPLPAIGRQIELEAIRTLLLHPNVRLVTLSGPEDVTACLDEGVSVVDLPLLHSRALTPTASSLW
jgi:hypothetical protein